jgi:two-component system cell cycle sensor histidine kinase/response regulator CckA
VLSSGYNEVEVIQRFTGKGLAGFLQKPYTSAALVDTVERVLRG